MSTLNSYEVADCDLKAATIIVRDGMEKSLTLKVTLQVLHRFVLLKCFVYATTGSPES